MTRFSDEKLRVIWDIWIPRIGDSMEASVLSEKFYTDEQFYEDGFLVEFIPSLEKKYNAGLDPGGDSMFFELRMIDDVQYGPVDEVAGNILIDMERYLEKTGK